MTRTKAILLATFTVWPFLYMFVFMSFMFVNVASTGQDRSGFDIFQIIFALHLLTMLETLALITYYIVHLFRTSAVAPDKKALWAVVLFLGGMLAMPVYWYIYVWKTIPPNDSASHTA